MVPRMYANDHGYRCPATHYRIGSTLLAFEISDIVQTMRFKTEVMDARVRVALADAFDALETSQAVTFRKTVNAAMDFKKGELVLVPYTALTAFTIRDSAKALGQHRDQHAHVPFPSGDCNLGDDDLECFLKAPSMCRAGGEHMRTENHRTSSYINTAWEKQAYPIAYWLTIKAQHSNNPKDVNLVQAVVKHGGFNIPVLKNCVPLKDGDVLMLASHKRGRDVSLCDAVAQDTEDGGEVGGEDDVAGASACNTGTGPLGGRGQMGKRSRGHGRRGGGR